LEIAAPPSEPAVNARVSWPLPAVMVVRLGAAGVLAGVALRAFEGPDSPALFTALNRTVYSVPLVNPVIVTGEDVTPADTKSASFIPVVEYS